ncbi:MAG: DUF917 family protein [Pseudomonadota bacterium]
MKRTAKAHPLPRTFNGRLSSMKTSALAIVASMASFSSLALAQTTHYDPGELNEMLYGLSFLASGGGGGFGDGQIIIENILDKSPSGIDIQDASGIQSTDTLIVGAGIGSPESLDDNLEGLIVAVNASIGIVLGQTPATSVLSVESGPANAFIAALINVENGSPIFDGDGAGRSVPSLTNTVYSDQTVYPIAPVAIAAAPTDPSMPPPATMEWDSSEVPDAAAAEDKIRDLISTDPAYDSVAGLALWEQTGTEFAAAPFIEGTYALASAIGSIMKANDTDFFRTVADLEPLLDLRGRSILGADLGTISSVTSQTIGGFDVGTLTADLSRDGRTVTADIKSENENLLSTLTFTDPDSGDVTSVVVTAPTLISFVVRDPDTNLFVPYNNGDDLSQYINQDIGIIWSLADQRLYGNATGGLLDTFRTQLATVGYTGPICPNINNLMDPWDGCITGPSGGSSGSMDGWPSSAISLVTSLDTPLTRQ